MMWLPTPLWSSAWARQAIVRKHLLCLKTWSKRAALQTQWRIILSSVFLSVLVGAGLFCKLLQKWKRKTLNQMKSHGAYWGSFLPAIFRMQLKCFQCSVPLKTLHFLTFMCCKLCFFPKAMKFMTLAEFKRGGFASCTYRKFVSWLKLKVGSRYQNLNATEESWRQW